MPEGWQVVVGMYANRNPPAGWYAHACRIGEGWTYGDEQADGDREPLYPNTRGPDELTARYRLAVACSMAEKEQKT